MQVLINKLFHSVIWEYNKHKHFLHFFVTMKHMKRKKNPVFSPVLCYYQLITVMNWWNSHLASSLFLSVFVSR